MARRCLGWSSAFLAADGRDKGRFLLNVACYAHMQDDLRPTIVGLLISLLCELERHILRLRDTSKAADWTAFRTINEQEGCNVRHDGLHLLQQRGSC
jgi:hypothetical protein